MARDSKGVSDSREVIVVERCLVPPVASYSREIALMLFARRPISSAVVVCCASPERLHSAVRKNWLHLIRKLELDKAKTLDTVKRKLIDNEINAMRNVWFVVGTGTTLGQKRRATMPPSGVVHLVALEAASGFRAIWGVS